MVKQLRDLAAAGMTSQQIADVIGISRGAVMGKARREGIALLGKPATFGGRGWRPPDPAGSLPVSERSGVRNAMAALELNHCRWPIGAVEEPDFHYCSEPKAELTRPYCAKHEAKAAGARSHPLDHAAKLRLTALREAIG